MEARVHKSSFEKVRSIRDVYIKPGAKVLDVGAAAFQTASYRLHFPASTYEYTGLDITPGPNVDLVVADSYDWKEIETDTFDAVISGQTFEHNPFFWITIAEMARVAKPEGVIAVIAPSTGDVHRYPFDCWRFYPDAWASLAAYVGIELLESEVEAAQHKTIEGLRWRDSTMIARKPALATARERDAFYERLARVRSTATAAPPAGAVHGRGPALSDYERRTHKSSTEVLMWRCRLAASASKRWVRSRVSR
jgi:SAM-dependent methyltransferase